MARLVMNMLQFEFGLIPAIILKEDKEDYIKALVENHIARLKAEGIIKRIGPDKGGHWVLSEQE